MPLRKCSAYIYQGEEIGMTNVPFERLDQYRDIETLNFYKERTESGVSHEAMMHALHENSRDNARTPMHWDSSVHGGFTQGQPWIEVNPNYPQINVAAALDDSDSIFYHYQKLIKLRKEHSSIVYGDFIPLLEEHDKVFAYMRSNENETIVVVNNFSQEAFTLSAPVEIAGLKGTSLIANYEPREQVDQEISLKPYESFVIQINA